MTISVLWQHPLGDLLSPLCSHWVADHPNGHDVPVPCVHLRSVRVGWKTVRGVTVPDMQTVADHANDGMVHVPCTHMHRVHPAGNCDFGPCLHPLLPVRRDNDRHIVYYSNVSALRTEAETAYDKLVELGVPRNKIATPTRPLLLLNRPPATDGTQTDPMWSHYDPGLHSIQIMQGHDIRQTLFHELGHAIVGQRCIRVMAPGESHSVNQRTNPGDALSEGWADFVAGAIALARDQDGANFGNINLDGVPTGLPAPSRDIEVFVARCLWDLYDTGRISFTVDAATGRFRRHTTDDDNVSIAFKDLYGVFLPTPATASAGPTILHLNDFIARLTANLPARRAAIERVVALNFP